MMRFSRVPLVTIAAVALLSAASSAELEPGAVTFEEGNLSVRVEGVSAGEAFDAVTKAASVDVRAPASIRARELTIQIENVPLEAAMEKMFRAIGVENVATITKGDGKLAFVVFDAGGSAPTVVSKPAEPKMAEAVAVTRGGSEADRAARPGEIVREALPLEEARPKLLETAAKLEARGQTRMAENFRRMAEGRPVEGPLLGVDKGEQ